jgi:hypothetical protein
VQYLSKTELYRVEEITQTNKKTPPAKPLSLAVKGSPLFLKIHITLRQDNKFFFCQPR